MRVARQLVMFLKRTGGQSQFSVMLEPLSSTRRIENLRQYIAQHLGEPLSMPDLAEQMHVSERQLARVFKTELGTTPAAYLEAARVEAARQQLRPPMPRWSGSQGPAASTPPIPCTAPFAASWAPRQASTATVFARPRNEAGPSGL